MGSLHLLTDARVSDSSREDLIGSGDGVKNLILYSFNKDISEEEIEDYFKTVPINESPTVAHYYWVGEALSLLLNLNLKNENFGNCFEQFVIKNKSKLDELNQFKTISEPNFLGQGAKGVVFLLDPGKKGESTAKVVKIYTNNDLHESNKKSFNDLYQNPSLSGTEMRFYDLGKLGDFYFDNSSLPIYYTVMDLVEPVFDKAEDYSEESDIERKIDEVTDCIHSAMLDCTGESRKQLIKLTKLTEAEKNSLFKKINNLVSEYLNSSIKNYIKDSFKLRDNWLEKFTEEYVVKWMTGRRDLACRNLGVNSNGYLVYYDPYNPSYDVGGIRKKDSTLNINNINKLANRFYRLASENKFAWVEDAEVPPEPGSTPIPGGHVRFYHYTGVNEPSAWGGHQAAESLKKDGILMREAKGNTYGEPNLVWASAEKPGNFKVFAEFSVSMDDERWRLGNPDKVTEGYSKFTLSPGNHYNISPEEYHRRGSNVGFIDSILPEEILAVHEPWHHEYRYILKNPKLIEKILAGKYDDLLDNQEYGPAIQKIKYEYKK